MRKVYPIPAHERYGLSREVAAQYLSIGVTLFDEMVNDGRMPPPREANKRRVWSRLELERAFNQLPGASWSGAAELGDVVASNDDRSGGDSFWNRVA